MPQPSKLSTFGRWLMNWNEGPLSLLALLAFIYAPRLLHQLDPLSGSFDLGYLHVIVLAVLLFYVSAFVAWNGLRMNFPGLYREFTQCLNKDLDNNTTNSQTWRVLFFSLLAYFFYFAAMMGLLLIVFLLAPR